MAGECGEEVAQSLLLGRTEAGDGGKALFGSDLHLLAQLASLRSDDEAFEPAIVRVDVTLDESFVFEVVGDEGDVRGVAAETTGEFAHGSGGVEEEQGPPLDGRQPEFPGHAVQVGPHSLGKAPDEPDEFLEQWVGARFSHMSIIP